MTITDSCRDCGGQIERLVTAVPASPALAVWWFHTSETEADWCPGSGPVGPDDPPEWVPDEETWAEAAGEYAHEEARR